MWPAIKYVSVKPRIIIGAFNSIKQSTFPKISHLNAVGSKFDLDVK